MGVLAIRALLFKVYLKVLEFWKLPFEAIGAYTQSRIYTYKSAMGSLVSSSKSQLGYEYGFEAGHQY